MKKEILVPIFGQLSEGQLQTISMIVSKVWGLTPVLLGSMASPDFFENLPFKKEIEVPLLIFDSKVINVEYLCPNYNKVREGRENIKVIVCISDINEIPTVSSDLNMPNFFLDLVKGQLIIV